MMHIKVRRFIKTRVHELKDESSISIKYREDDETVIYLMRKFILDGWSVLLITDDPHHYYGVQDIAPTAIRGIDSKTLQEEISFPWLKGISIDGAQIEEDILRTYMRKPHMTGMENLIPDPNDRQCYYEISMKGSKLQKCFVESFISGIYYQLCMQEPAQRIVVFAQAPFRPKTKMAEHMLRQALEHGLKIIYMFKGSGVGRNSAKYSFRYKHHTLYVDYKGRSYEVEDDTHE